MPLKLNGSVSGFTQLQAAATALNNTLTLPTGTGTLLVDDGSGNVTIANNLTVSGTGNSSFGGNVGVGTTSPTEKLNVVGGNIKTDSSSRQIGYWEADTVHDGYMVPYNASGQLEIVNSFSAGAVLFKTGTSKTERMRIDSSGNVGIGTSSPNYVMQLYKAGAVANYLQVTSGATGAASGNGTLFGVDASGNGIVTVQGAANYITSVAGSERMRIDSSGNLLVGYTSSNGSYKLQVNSQIFATSSTIATSDANYKTNIEPLTDALSLVKQLNPVSFSWKPHEVHNFDTQTPTIGFLAQEVQAVLADQPYVNSIIKRSEVTLPDDSKQPFLGIAEGNMIALLTKALQEAVVKIDTLETRLATLEAK